MGKSKKLYYLKLKKDFLNEETIKWLEEQGDSQIYAYFYIKLCLASLSTNGLLQRQVGDLIIPYNVANIAEVTRVPKDTVIVGIELLKKVGFVQIINTDVGDSVYVSHFEEMVGSETDAADRMRKMRERQRKRKQRAIDQAIHNTHK